MYIEMLKLFTLLKLSTEVLYAYFVEMIFIIAKKKKCMYFQEQTFLLNFYYSQATVDYLILNYTNTIYVNGRKQVIYN